MLMYGLAVLKLKLNYIILFSTTFELQVKTNFPRNVQLNTLKHC